MAKRGDFYAWRVAYDYPETEGANGTLVLSSGADVLREGGDLLRRGANIEIFHVDKATRKKTSYAKVTPDALPPVDPNDDRRAMDSSLLLAYLQRVRNAKSTTPDTSVTAEPQESKMPTMVPAESLGKGDTIYPEFDGHRGLLPGVVATKTKIETTYQGRAFLITLEDGRTVLYFAGQNVYCSRKR